MNESDGVGATNSANDEVECTKVVKRGVRSDWLRNRAAILMAARVVLAREGLNGPLEQVAAEAGVGIGTLYRHFPTRLDLWQAVLIEPLQAELELVEAALAEPDAWKAFSGFVMARCAQDADDCGYLNLSTTRYEGAPELEKLSRAIYRQVVRLFRKAWKAGVVRTDITVEDLSLLMIANARIVEVTRDIAPTAWKRNVELFLESVRPKRATPLEEPPMSPREVYRAMAHPRQKSRGKASRSDCV